MDLIEDSVKKMEEILRDTGCEDGAVTLRRLPDAVPCRYEQGVCIESCYGGRTGEFVTQDPVEATTRISFMFGASLDGPRAKGAACAVLNALTAFLCISRRVRACAPAAHPACLNELRQLLAGRRVCIIGENPALERDVHGSITKNPGDSEVILITGDGLAGEGARDIVSAYRERKELVCVGPSTAGVAGLQQLTRFCPYGR